MNINVNINSLDNLSSHPTHNTIPPYCLGIESCCVCCQDLSIYYYGNGNSDSVSDSASDSTTVSASDSNKKYLGLADMQPEMFQSQLIPDDLLIVATCNQHFICIGCIRRIVDNYENHPINEQNSHFSCPYPFAECISLAGTKNIFEHHLIKKVCRNETEWNNYISYATQYAFPGFTPLRCPFTSSNEQPCNAIILIENEELRQTPVGDLIVECTQNAMCNKRFCYYCHKIINYFHNICYDCKLNHENELPDVYNYYFNKAIDRSIASVITLADDDATDVILTFEESDYLFRNKEISVEIAHHQLAALLHNVNSYMICPICKISLYKTEKCNGLSHHGIERCYACGRIGFRSRGMGEHWNNCGIEGCFRFDHEAFVKKYVPDYMCNDTTCFNHDKGDCTIPEHQQGIIKSSSSQT